VQRRRLAILITPLALAVLLAAVPVARLVADEANCWDPPADVVAAAEDPEAAEEFFTAHTVGGSDLLAGDQWNTCDGPSGAELLGSVLTVATTGRTVDDQDAPARAHTPLMARVLEQTVTELAWGSDDTLPFPSEFAPHLARILAAYVGDVQIALFNLEVYAPFEEEFGDEERARLGGESDRSLAVMELVEWLCADPEAYAILYDAFRAYFAHYLDHLTWRDGDLAAGVGVAPSFSGFGAFELTTAGLVFINAAREAHIEEGDIEDAEAFDRAVAEHSDGLYLASPEPPGDPPRQGEIALRPADAPAEASPEPVTDPDGHQRLAHTLDRWAAERDIPAALSDQLDAMLERAYLFGVDHMEWDHFVSYD
jgi:hypothetical protein